MSFSKLPPELLDRIISDCMKDLHERFWDVKMRYCFEYPGWRSPDPIYLSGRTDFENGQDTHSDLWKAMPDLDVEGLMESPLQRPKYYGEYRTLAVLYVCRAWSRAAIRLWYGEYTFAFESPATLRLFSNNAWEMHNNEFVRDVRIHVNAWDWSECMGPGPGGHGPCGHAPDWEEWMEFFEEKSRGLLWHFPGLETLRIDFTTNKENSLFGDFHVDGGESGVWGHLPAGVFGWLPRQQGFECFQNMLRTKVRVKKVEVEGLYDWYVETELAREMMGFDKTDGHSASKEAEGSAEEWAGWNAALA